MTGPVDRREVEELLLLEAYLLDARDLDGWLELFTEDATYWLPMGDEDPDHEPSLVFDDRQRMEERVFRLLDTPAYAQMPPSRTLHNITNIRVLESSPSAAQVSCHLVVHEVRIGDPSQVGLASPRSFPASCTYRLIREDRALLIQEKVVRLLSRELPQYNLTFIV